MTETLVLGIGNTLLSDEGVGVHVIRYLAEHHPRVPGVDYMDGGTLSFLLAPAIEDARNLIVIDAAQLDAAPGTVRRLLGSAMDRFLNAGKLSVHEVGLADLMDMVRLSGHLPRKRALIAVQPDSVDWGDGLSAPVAQAIPRVIRDVLDLVSDWNRDAAARDG